MVKHHLRLELQCAASITTFDSLWMAFFCGTTYDRGTSRDGNTGRLSRARYSRHRSMPIRTPSFLIFLPWSLDLSIERDWTGIMELERQDP
jgi:hypothetical protein